MRKLLLIPLLSGCAGVAIFVVGSLAVEHGAMKISDNYAYTDYRASREATWNALTAELEARGIKYEVNKAGQRLTANGHTAEAVKHPRDPDYTRIQVKVGLFGKQKEKHSKIRAFLHAVGGRLGQDSLVPEFPGAKYAVSAPRSRGRGPSAAS